MDSGTAGMIETPVPVSNVAARVFNTERDQFPCTWDVYRFQTVHKKNASKAKLAMNKNKWNVKNSVYWKKSQTSGVIGV